LLTLAGGGTRVFAWRMTNAGGAERFSACKLDEGYQVARAGQPGDCRDFYPASDSPGRRSVEAGALVLYSMQTVAGKADAYASS